MCRIRRLFYNTFLFLLLISVFVFAGTISAGPVPETGQTQSYTATFGEDSDYTINPQSYTKLDEMGNDLPDTETLWAMVRDNVTGLVWEVKTDDGSIHDRDNAYNWNDAQDVFITALNNANFGGFSDWRMPTVKELSFIVNSGRYWPAINIDYLPNTVSSYYWSSASYAPSPADAWQVDLYYGRIGHSNKSGVYYVRAVRGGQ